MVARTDGVAESAGFPRFRRTAHNAPLMTTAAAAPAVKYSMDVTVGWLLVGDGELALLPPGFVELVELVL